MIKTVAYSFTGKVNGFPQILLNYILNICTYQKPLGNFSQHEIDLYVLK